MFKRIGILIFLFCTLEGLTQPKDSLLLRAESSVDTIRFMANLELTSKYRFIDMDTSEMYLKQAKKDLELILGRFINQKTEKFKGFYYYQKALNFQYLSLFDSASSYYERSMVIFKHTNQLRKQAKLLINYGALFEQQGEYAKALETYFIALDQCEKNHQKKEQSKVYNNIALIYNNQEKYEDALNYYNKSLELKKTLGLKRGVALIYNNIGVTYYYLEKYDKVLESFKRSLNIYREIGDIRSQALPYFNIAEVNSLQHNNKEALYYYKKSYEIFKKLNDKSGQADVLFSIGEVYASMKLYVDALRVQKEAATIHESLGSKSSLYPVYEALSETYTQVGDYRRALEYYHLFTIYKDSVYSLQKSKQIVQMKEKYESDKKEERIAILEQENKIKELENKRQKEEIDNRQKVTFLSLLIAALGLFALILIYRLYSQKKISTHLLSIKNREVNNKNIEVSRGYRQYEEMLCNLNTFWAYISQESFQNTIHLHNITTQILGEYDSQSNVEERILVERITKKLITKLWNVKVVSEFVKSHPKNNEKTICIAETADFLEQKFSLFSEQKKMKFHVKIDKSCPNFVTLNPEYFILALINILQNSISENAQKSDIALIISYEDGNLFAQFKNSFISISEAKKKIMYKASLQKIQEILTLKNSDEFELLVLKILCDALEGSICIDSKGVNEEIVISVPVEKGKYADFQFASLISLDNETDPNASRVQLDVSEQVNNKKLHKNVIKNVSKHIISISSAVRKRDWNAIVETVVNAREQGGNEVIVFKEELNQIERECVTTKNIDAVEKYVVAMSKKYMKMDK